MYTKDTRLIRKSIEASRITHTLFAVYPVLLFAFVIPAELAYSDDIPQEVDFVVYSNESRSALPLNASRFIMHDNSRIELSPSGQEFSFRSIETYIGNDTKIAIAWPDPRQARDGIPGSDGGNCQTGGSASPGQDGRDGRDAPNLVIDFGTVHSFGSLTIDLSGEPGQPGGEGGAGGNGGRADTSEWCKGGNGGNGGTGGDGGAGGAGGVVEFTWKAPEGIEPNELRRLTTAIESGLKVIAASGQDGSRGAAGAGGNRGSSKCTQFGFFKICRGAGVGGQRGDPGK